VAQQNVPGPQDKNQLIAQFADRVEVIARTDEGNASYLTGRNRQPIPVQVPANRAKASAADFLNQYGQLLGISDVARETVETGSRTCELAQIHTSFQQVYEGVPVFSGVVRVHQNQQGDVLAANGQFRNVPQKLNSTPTLTVDAALESVLADTNPDTLTVEQSDLVVVDPGWYGDASVGARLAYHVVVSDMTVPMREAMFIDAHTGETLDEWSILMTARVREVYNGLGGSSLPGSLSRAEGDPPVGSPADTNRAYDYAGDVYDYFFRGHNRDSIDGNGMTLVLTVNSTNPPCPNAGWNGAQMVFCTGTVTDDITAHEIAHGVTERTANLIYQNQSGQLNEAYSDIFGELIDLYNGDASLPGTPGGGSTWPTHPTGEGQDTPNNARSACSSAPSYPDGVRWMMGEDASAFGGAIRDMWDPTCEGDPDRNNSPLQTCSPFDNGGVHSGSGVANHTFAIMTDGKTFNGQTVTAIGPIKAGAVWYRALTTYLTPSSDYNDAYNAINLAAADLIGTTPQDPITGLTSGSVFTASDALQVDKAMIATEMNTDGSCGSTVDILNPTPPSECDPQTSVFADDFESGAPGWTVSLSGSPTTPYNWVLSSSMPGATGTGWFCDNLADGCPGGAEESAVHRLTSPVINLPSVIGDPTIKFRHVIASESGYDGGNVKLSINGGPWTLVPNSAFTYNGYNTSLNGGSNTNPLAGEEAWSGAGGSWGTSLIDLTPFVSANDTVQVRFEFGKDFCNGVDGWYVDDFELYLCSCASSAECDDGVYCNGEETCTGGFCQDAADPCVGGYCDEDADVCVSAAFVEDFENGNVQGWSLAGPGTTASSGDWLFGNPNGTSTGGDQAQPENPYLGSGCAFTAQNTDLGVDDVDGGVVYLESPTIDLGGESSAQLDFVRWFYQRDINDDSGDFFVADVSNNNGGSWTNLETLGQNQSENTWTARSFDLEMFVTLTSTMKIRFGASDGTSDGDIVEAAIDDLRITVSPECIIDNDCDNGDLCDGVETCVGGACQPGTPLTCDDTNDCTDDSCVPATGCVFTNNTDPCDDSNACTTVDVCSGGACVGSSPLVCDDANICTDDTCDSITGCEFTNNTNPCNDDDACTTVDECSGGACVGSVPLVCDDGLFCTGAESCDQIIGCVAGSDPCVSGTWCEEGGDVCVPFGDGDIDFDGDVDLLDFHAMQSCYGQPATGGCEALNLSGDAMVDDDDLQLFIGLIVGPS
jgi:Zn-dependent metalloprotease